MFCYGGQPCLQTVSLFHFQINFHLSFRPFRVLVPNNQWLGPVSSFLSIGFILSFTKTAFPDNSLVEFWGWFLSIILIAVVLSFCQVLLLRPIFRQPVFRHSPSYDWLCGLRWPGSAGCLWLLLFRMVYTFPRLSFAVFCQSSLPPFLPAQPLVSFIFLSIDGGHFITAPAFWLAGCHCLAIGRLFSNLINCPFLSEIGFHLLDRLPYVFYAAIIFLLKMNNDATPTWFHPSYKLVAFSRKFA